jgi:hypothetical protein
VDGDVARYATPEEAALDSMPPGISHVVATRRSSGGRSAWVLLAVEATGSGYYLDENVCEQTADGTWVSDSSSGGGFTDRSLDSLRADPPGTVPFS